MTDGTRPHPPSPTILLVEDEPAIRLPIRRMLEGAGQELLVVRNGYEALTVAKRQRGVIDLLSTDIVMPRMNGFELGEQIGSGLPETNVLFLSGFFKGSTAVRNGLGAAGRAPRSPEMPPLYPYGP